MKRGIIIYIMCIMCYSNVHSQTIQVSVSELPPPGTDTEDTLYYSTARKLTWADFQGNVRKEKSPKGLLNRGYFNFYLDSL